MVVKKSPLGFPEQGPIFCPRCDRAYRTINEKRIDTIERLKRHVTFQHPDHDPMWYETYPYADEKDKA